MTDQPFKHGDRVWTRASSSRGSSARPSGIEIRTLSGNCRFVRGACLHADVVPVEAAITGELVAQLCTSCDMQLEADWTPSYAAPTLAELNTATITALIEENP